MIVINLTGQLGNQMFQYALGRHLQLQGKKVLYHTAYYRQHPEHYFGLGRFGLEIPVAKETDVLTFQEDRHRMIDRLRRKLFGAHPHVFSEINSESLHYRKEIFDLRKGFVDGYWQSEKYFDEIADVIRKDFTFPRSDNPKNDALVEEMQNCTSVSIHVRRGDYLGGFPVMDEKYFFPAMEYFANKYENVRFYVFSNDLVWCREHLKGEQMVFVDWNTGKDSLFDMWLMTQCKHNIIANSSFSWWGAWLNQHEGKEVVAPNLWFTHAETPDVYADGWKVFPCK